MCDNTAVSWSEYSQHTSNLETEIRHKISRDLLENIDFLKNNNVSDCYIRGVEWARSLVLSNTNITGKPERVETQEKLF